jgi:hypothetical protein
MAKRKPRTGKTQGRDKFVTDILNDKRNGVPEYMLTLLQPSLFAYRGVSTGITKSAICTIKTSFNITLPATTVAFTLRA